MDAAIQTKLDKVFQVVDLFNRVFSDSGGREGDGTRLQGGYPEPFYRAPNGDAPAEIHFTRDYLNSCFHEVAHWCIAGKTRRLQDDYGYWYRPDGRNGQEQEEFFQAEAGPQALEWVFAAASGEAFRMSCDNLAGEVKGEAEFSAALHRKLRGYLEKGFPPRGGRFLAGLMEMYHPEVGKQDIPTWLLHRTLSPQAPSALAPEPH